ncbi:uncharacterized protein LOC142319014 [Lycorma delicatula]|uniref:uncharacterized protein LOC142319014 n=1 Tax=Lycorma delicatula TaxID=130591 RepID=UPI003F510C64
MEMSVVPSQFLSVVITEERGNNHIASAATSTFTPNGMIVTDKKTVPAPIRPPHPPIIKESSENEMSIKKEYMEEKQEDEEIKVPQRINGLTDKEKWDLTKHLPKALLAECTVEIHSSMSRPEKLPQRPCFDARVSPIFSKQTTVITLPIIKKPGCVLPGSKSAVKKEITESEDEGQDAGDILDMIEAVYSDHDSEDETEIESDAVVVLNNSHSSPPDVVIKPETLTQPSIMITTVGGTPKFSFKCEHCPNIYPNRGALWQHSVATHSVEKTCECKICGRKFYRNCSLALHLKSHSEEEYCACKECGKSFTRLINLERHMKMHSDVEQLQCDQCDKTFSDRTNLLRHTVCHVSTAVRTHQCDTCGKSYKSQDHLEIHYQSAHSSISCSVCGKSFSSFAELTKHDATHTFEQRYLCKYCGKSYSQKAVLRKHLIIHTGERLKCNTCSIEFTQRSSLLRHVKRMHSSSGQVINNPVTAKIISDPITKMDVDENFYIKPDIKENEYDDIEEEEDEEEEEEVVVDEEEEEEDDDNDEVEIIEIDSF